jgi:tetratricopeptide (TPR) repeat protein
LASPKIAGAALTRPTPEFPPAVRHGRFSIVKPLEYLDQHHLRAAQGWLELNNTPEAQKELEQIAPEFHDHPEVLDVRWRICAYTKNWEGCVELAEAGIQLDPHRPDGWIHRSFALHEMKRTQQAFDQLRPVADRFPSVWTIPYNLACYCAQLGRLEECNEWFQRAIAIDAQSVKQSALDDPDLKPFRDRFRSALRKRPK